MNLSKSVRFAFNAMNAVKKNSKAEKIFFHRLRGEKKVYTATSRMRWNKIFQHYKQNAVKIFNAKIANLTNIQRANFNAYLIFTGNIFEVTERCRSGFPIWWHAEVEVRTRVRQFLFVRIPINAVKKIFHR